MRRTVLLQLEQEIADAHRALQRVDSINDRLDDLLEARRAVSDSPEKIAELHSTFVDDLLKLLERT